MKELHLGFDRYLGKYYLDNSLVLGRNRSEFGSLEVTAEMMKSLLRQGGGLLIRVGKDVSQSDLTRLRRALGENGVQYAPENQREI